MSKAVKAPSLWDALLPIALLVTLLAMSVYLYGSDSSYGANQIALLLASGLALIVGLKNGHSWLELEKGIIDGITMSLNAVLILLAVGALIGAFILSGTVPAMIYLGLKLLDPSYFYAATCLICCIVSVSIGSSWTTAGTIGVALIGVAQTMGLSPAITAGAIISGAYFGDKISPLSDTTNLAPAVAGSELFTHIRHLLWTTTPSILIALIVFVIFGLTGQHKAVSEDTLQASLDLLSSTFDISWYVLIPVVLLFVMAVKKVPAFPSIFIAALIGGLFAVLFQQSVILKFVGEFQGGEGWALLKGVWSVLASGYTSATGNAAVDELLSRGGMSSMLNTIWLIICAMVFGASLEKTGLLQVVVNGILRIARGTASLVTATVLSCIGTNIIAADQYISIVLPGRMFKAEFERRGLAPENLSRTLEDAGTITSVLIPWNTCGAFMAGTLGVPTLTYLPYAIFNLLNPLVAITYALFNVKLRRLTDEELALLRAI
ncbi:Na+/H+ antiporter NhaC [Permianibacter aggregans]|uniref:Transporter (NhaC family) n=1 Tax=Permianibacter aggregans TaxID=1510150 RepID=A0A4R6UXL6_9GAMM|nr:Na+/H+ antiporter NhaC [Permianibacter aggregans]QGX38855.1 Na+/H+ antiporter NhaC [Permianibacter aggregans]TDQ50663.1 transporter (NhaC family) [Permianibacter aggregans]